MEGGFLDEKGMDAKDRFLLMLIDRVQALETSVALLEAEASTDSMSVIVDVRLSIGDITSAAAAFGGGGGAVGGMDELFGGIMSRLFGGGEIGPNDLPDVQALGEALLAARVDVAEVTLARKNKPRRNKAQEENGGGGGGDMSFQSSMQQMFDAGAPSKFLLTVRLHAPVFARQSAMAIQAAWDAMIAATTASVNKRYSLVGDWVPTSTSAKARAFAADGGGHEFSRWTCDAAPPPVSTPSAEPVPAPAPHANAPPRAAAVPMIETMLGLMAASMSSMM